MKKILITEKDIVDEYEILENDDILDVIYDTIRYDLDYALYYNHFDIKVIDTDCLTVEITKIHDYVNRDVNLSYDFAIEYGTLLSLCTDLDYAFYNSDIELWNAICKDENLINHRNINDVYSESIFFLFDDIENQIWKTSELPTDDDIWTYINDYKFKELIDVDELYNYISLSINELDKWTNNAINNWFENDLYDIYDDNFHIVLNDIINKVELNGEYECYI